jgi:hypothetical protein
MMRNLLTAFLLITVSILDSYGQNEKMRKSDNKFDSLIIKIDQIQQQLQRLLQMDKSDNAIKHSGEVTIKAPEKTLSLNDYAPWIASLFIGILSYVVGRGQISKMTEQIKLGRQTLETQKEIAINEIKKNVILSNRQKWISELRDLISELVSLMQFLDAKLRLAFKKVDREEYILNQNADRINKLLKYDAQIKLMLNLKEQKHKALIDEMGEYEYLTDPKESIEKKKEISEKNDKVIQQIITLSQEILKEEWERIKNLD